MEGGGLYWPGPPQLPVYRSQWIFIFPIEHISFRKGLDSMLKLIRNYINPIGFAEQRRSSVAVAAQRRFIPKFSLADFLSSFNFAHFLSAEFCFHWLTKKKTLPLVGWSKKYLSVNYCDFLTPTDSVTENPHIHIWLLRNITNPAYCDSVKMC
jgi:hypothetical protein